MSTPDETHHEPPRIHDEVLAKTGPEGSDHGHGTSAANTPADDHAHSDDHAHPTATHFIPENSGLDKLLQFIVAPAAALGLIIMMYTIAMTPIQAEEAESGAGAGEQISAPAR